MIAIFSQLWVALAGNCSNSDRWRRPVSVFFAAPVLTRLQLSLHSGRLCSGRVSSHLTNPLDESARVLNRTPPSVNGTR
ncbi:hypothetical protein C8Q79DRAFT_417916 [Trametes meyenii]|nr:hypothetical protein C8Q79DRAFT_417916 [Trametes meyenii]